MLCPKCGTHRLDFGGPHAPHLVERDGAWFLVDCAETTIQVLKTQSPAPNEEEEAW